MAMEDERPASRSFAWTLLCLRGLLMVASVLAMLAFVVAAWQRLHFAYEYDWIEDGMLMCLRRIHSGLPLYTAPGIYFTPYLYTPVYLYVAALLAKCTGVSYVPLRLLSIFSTVGCFGVIYALVFTETRRHFAAIVAAGLFAACYPAVDGSYDVGRVDMLWILLVLCALFATRRLHPLFAAVLWVCAFQTKQGVLPIALLTLCWPWHRPRRVLLGVGGFLVLLGASIAWMNHATGGWYGIYVFHMAGGFDYDMHKALQFLPDDLLSVCGIALVLILAALVLARKSWRKPVFSFYALSSVGMVVFIGYIRAHRGANTNTLIPAYAWIAVLFGVALARLYPWFAARSSRWMRTALVVMMLAATVQMAQQAYWPGDWSTSPEETAFRNAFESTVQSIPGDVLVFSHPEYARLAGKTEYASSEATGEVIEAAQQQNGDQLMADYAALIHSHTLSAVVTDWPAEQFLEHRRVWMPRDFLAHYPLRVEAAGGDARRFTSQPKYIYLPCPAAGAVDVARALDAQVDESVCSR
jgi:hypothetical protein